MTIVGIFLYVAIDVVLVFLRPTYDWIHNAESDYGRGPYFWLMDINFLLRCLLSVALVKALYCKFPKNRNISRSSIWLIIWSLASGLLAFFADNPYGYPKLRSGSVHLVIAFVAFISILIAMILFRRFPSELGLNRANAFVNIGLAGLAVISLVLLGHSGFSPNSLGGIYERIFLASVLAWEFVLAISIGTHKHAFPDIE